MQDRSNEIEKLIEKRNAQIINALVAAIKSKDSTFQLPEAKISLTDKEFDGELDRLQKSIDKHFKNNPSQVINAVKPALQTTEMPYTPTDSAFIEDRLLKRGLLSRSNKVNIREKRVEEFNTWLSQQESKQESGNESDAKIENEGTSQYKPVDASLDSRATNVGDVSSQTTSSTNQLNPSPHPYGTRSKPGTVDEVDVKQGSVNPSKNVIEESSGEELSGGEQSSDEERSDVEFSGEDQRSSEEQVPADDRQDGDNELKEGALPNTDRLKQDLKNSHKLNAKSEENKNNPFEEVDNLIKEIESMKSPKDQKKSENPLGEKKQEAPNLDADGERQALENILGEEQKAESDNEQQSDSEYETPPEEVREENSQSESEDVKAKNPLDDIPPLLEEKPSKKKKVSFEKLDEDELEKNENPLEERSELDDLIEDINRLKQKRPDASGALQAEQTRLAMLKKAKADYTTVTNQFHPLTAQLQSLTTSAATAIRPELETIKNTLKTIGTKLSNKALKVSEITPIQQQLDQAKISLNGIDEIMNPPNPQPSPGSGPAPQTTTAVTKEALEEEIRRQTTQLSTLKQAWSTDQKIQREAQPLETLLARATTALTPTAANAVIPQALLDTTNTRLQQNKTQINTLEKYALEQRLDALKQQLTEAEGIAQGMHGEIAALPDHKKRQVASNAQTHQQSLLNIRGMIDTLAANIASINPSSVRTEDIQQQKKQALAIGKLIADEEKRQDLMDKIIKPEGSVQFDPKAKPHEIYNYYNEKIESLTNRMYATRYLRDMRMKMSKENREQTQLNFLAKLSEIEAQLDNLAQNNKMTNAMYLTLKKKIPLIRSQLSSLVVKPVGGIADKSKVVTFANQSGYEAALKQTWEDMMGTKPSAIPSSQATFTSQLKSHGGFSEELKGNDFAWHQWDKGATPSAATSTVMITRKMEDTVTNEEINRTDVINIPDTINPVKILNKVTADAEFQSTYPNLGAQFGAEVWKSMQAYGDEANVDGFIKHVGLVLPVGSDKSAIKAIAKELEKAYADTLEENYKDMMKIAMEAVETHRIAHGTDKPFVLNNSFSRGFVITVAQYCKARAEFCGNHNDPVGAAFYNSFINDTSYKVDPKYLKGSELQKFKDEILKDPTFKEVYEGTAKKMSLAAKGAREEEAASADEKYIAMRPGKGQ